MTITTTHHMPTIVNSLYERLLVFTDSDYEYSTMLANGIAEMASDNDLITFNDNPDEFISFLTIVNEMVGESMHRSLKQAFMRYWDRNRDNTSKFIPMSMSLTYKS